MRDSTIRSNHLQQSGYSSDNKLSQSVRRRVLAWYERRWIRELLAYDDHLLADLGFCRETLIWAEKLPSAINASEVLRDIWLTEHSHSRRSSIHDF